ncbi:hypothetical protein N7519_005993 [Penicillium mononematosum]|uniref:uncharacterized protein n=1 Tax=Penicillium mononematosum TaxID=268346 RepID=UPI002549A51D|nr:uncharacterized protein N7519_005993 [Penicillium mononematosum]KAJ6184692.1 hypothetical protein N7519_005993 [Penicillium mononematosum]
MIVALSTVVIVLALVAIVRYRLQYNTKHRSPEATLEDVKALNIRHDVHSAFMALINDEGAGSWPPRATHDAFPAALRIYGQIYAAMAPFLANANPSLDDECNKVRCQEFRSRMQALLAEKVDIKAVRSALETVQSGNWDDFPRDAYNGFYSCIACLRHAYRFDITSPSGNIMANAVYNLDSHGKIVYPVNEGMSDTVKSTELAWSRIFYDSEVMAIPVYFAMIQAIIAFERRDKKLCLAHIETALINLRKVMQNLYVKMNDPHVSRAIWVRHISGIHSWGLTLETDDPPVEYGGLSGSQILLFLAVDAFLGIDRYHSDEELKMHISRNMRDFSATIRRYSFRKLLSEKSEDDIAIGKALEGMVKQLRSFRAVHKIRAVRYLSAPAPERVPMTAALSVLPSDGEKAQATDPYGSLDGMLAKRLNETV